MTRKPTHPIRRMAEDCRGWSNPFLLQRKIARRVKPLLDALERVVTAEHDFVKATGIGLDDPIAEAVAHARRLLAAWRAPLG